MPLAVSFYDVVTWLHVSAVVVGFGSTFAYGVIMAAAQRRDPRSVPALLRGVQANERTLVTGGALLVLITGLYLAAERWEFSDFFVAWGILAVLVLLAMTHGIFLPTDRRAAEAAERELERSGELGEEASSLAQRLARFGMLAGLIVILTVYVMTAKPFL